MFSVQLTGNRGNMSSCGTPDRLFLFFPDLNPLFFFSFSFFGAEMMTKFNKDLYAKIKGKKNEPFSSIGQRRLRVVEKDKEMEKEVVERGSSTLTLDEGHITSPRISIEEVGPPSKKCKAGDKGKEKVGSSVWADAGVAIAWANELLTPKEMREILSMPSHEMVSQHVHKLM